MTPDKSGIAPASRLRHKIYAPIAVGMMNIICKKAGKITYIIHTCPTVYFNNLSHARIFVHTLPACTPSLHLAVGEKPSLLLYLQHKTALQGNWLKIPINDPILQPLRRQAAVCTLCIPGTQTRPFLQQAKRVSATFVTRFGPRRNKNIKTHRLV